LAAPLEVIGVFDVFEGKEKAQFTPESRWPQGGPKTLEEREGAFWKGCRLKGQ